MIFISMTSITSAQALIAGEQGEPRMDTAGRLRGWLTSGEPLEPGTFQALKPGTKAVAFPSDVRTRLGDRVAGVLVPDQDYPEEDVLVTVRPLRDIRIRPAPPPEPAPVPEPDEPPAVALLRAVVDKSSVAELAHQLGVSQVTVYAWLRGKNEPRLTYARALQRLHGIPMDAWGES